MKVAFAEDNVKAAHGLGASKAFAIRTNAHAFKMLSSGLYSDKIGAVLREIGCNAADAHKLAHTPALPFEVKLPNRLDPEFWVKDWGPGLSPEDIEGLYTTYFSSSKQSSNDFTGAFGLGSKSPFSYTDSFTITSCFEGRQRTYSAYLGNDGCPAIMLLDDAPTSPEWSHGIKVTFPVKREDMNPFSVKAKQIYRWFDVMPTILGAPAITPWGRKRDGVNFFIPEEATIPGVLMGNVWYPLDSTRAGDLLTCLDVTLKLDIGEVEVAASRENLQYSPDSVKALEKRVALAEKELVASLLDELNKLGLNTWEGKCAARTRLEALTDGGSWQLKDILIKHGVPAHLAEVLFQSTCKAGNLTVGPIIRKLKARQPNQIVSPSTSFHVNLITKTAVIVSAGEPHPLVRVKAKIEDHTYEQVILITPKDATDKSMATVGDQIASQLGMKVTPLSDLPLPAAWLATYALRKKSKKKGTVLTPPSFDAKFVDGSVTDTAKVRSDCQYIMTKIGASGWSRRDKGRAGGSVFFLDEWKRIWLAYLELQKELKIDGPQNYVCATSTDLRNSGYKALGWGDVHTAVGQWIAQPSVKDALLKRMKTKKVGLAVEQPRGYGYNGDQLLPVLGWIRKTHASIWKAIQPILVQHKLEVPPELAAGTDKEPPCMAQYREIAKWFEEQVPEQVRCLTIEDITNAVNARFPLSNTLTGQAWNKILTEHPETVPAILSVLLSKEVP